MTRDRRQHEAGCPAAALSEARDANARAFGEPRGPHVLLVSTYDLGRQPFGLASPAAWLAEAGADVRCVDLAVESLDEAAVQAADFVAFHLPMHTATRIAIGAARRVREISPSTRLCFFGLYAPLNASRLLELGAVAVLGGEFERELVDTVLRLAPADGGGNAPQAPGGARAHVSLERQRFRVPDRSGLPPLESYAHLVMPDGSRRTAGYTESSRGCLHLCRHCPVVPVYGGRFTVVQRDVVLEDVRRQVAAGARHITFGDPDFLNGPGHALALVESMHEEFPELTYDATIKVEHLIRHERHLGRLAGTGCLFVTSAVESIDDAVLEKLDKGHTRADFVRAVELCRQAGLELSPTFIPFHPWTSLDGYRQLLDELERLELVGNVAPVQLAIRLLIPAGSRLLELDEVAGLVGPFDPDGLAYPWRHADPRVDALQGSIERLVSSRGAGAARGAGVFEEIRTLAKSAASSDRASAGVVEPQTAAPRRAPIPYLEEPWYC